MSLLLSFYNDGRADDLSRGCHVEIEGLASIGGVRIGALVSDALSLSRASWASGVHKKRSDFLRSRYRGKPFSREA